MTLSPPTVWVVTCYSVDDESTDTAGVAATLGGAMEIAETAALGTDFVVERWEDVSPLGAPRTWFESRPLKGQFYRAERHQVHP